MNGPDLGKNPQLASTSRSIYVDKYYISHLEPTLLLSHMTATMLEIFEISVTMYCNTKPCPRTYRVYSPLRTRIPPGSGGKILAQTASHGKQQKCFQTRIGDAPIVSWLPQTCRYWTREYERQIIRGLGDENFIENLYYQHCSGWEINCKVLIITSTFAQSCLWATTAKRVALGIYGVTFTP